MNILKIIVGIICLFGSVSWAGIASCAGTEGGKCNPGTSVVVGAAKKANESQ